MGTYGNDIRPRNTGRNGLVVDPVHPIRDPIGGALGLSTAAGAAVTAVGGDR